MATFKKNSADKIPDELNRGYCRRQSKTACGEDW